MSSEQDQIRSIAERVARRLAASKDAGGSDASAEDLVALRRGLAEIQRRLAHVESHLQHDDVDDARGPETRAGANAAPGDASARRRATAAGATPATSLWLSGTYLPVTEHPSQERFEVGEAVSELVDYFEREKTCSVEPGGKPCDHCGMCSTRGF